MPYSTNFGDAIATPSTLQSPAAVTADGNTTGVDISNYEGEILVLAMNNAGSQSSGSDRTMAWKLQESSDDSTYTDVTGGGFTALTTAASVQKISLNSNELKKYLRINYDIGGTNTPTYTIGAVVLGNLKNPS